jgi:hypothetical protein
MTSDNPSYIKLPSDQKQISTGMFPTGAYTPAGVFSTDATENLIRQKGIKVRHYRFALTANRVAVEGGVNIADTIGQKNFTYYDPHDLFIDIQQLGWSDTYMMQGIYGNFQISSVNYCSRYEDFPSKRSYLRANDILVDDSGITAATEDIFEYNGREYQRLRFPIEDVDYLSSATTRFFLHTDFSICEGQIHWINGGAKPTFTNGKGEVLSIVYFTKPYYQVIATPRVFRAAYTNTYGNPNQPAQLTYFPGSAIIKMLWSTRIDFDLPDWSLNNIPQQGVNIV